MHQIVIKNIKNSINTSQETINQFLDFLANNQGNLFSRDNVIGHVTCSMLVLNEEKTEVLLTEHKKFNKWLQFGGHNDVPNETPLEAAVREMFEEGFGNKKISFTLLSEHPIDIDAHMAGNHMHYDICFVCVVKNDIEVVCSQESKKVEWKKVKEVLEDTDNLYDKRLKRMVQKAINLDNNLSNITDKIQSCRYKSINKISPK